MEDIPKSECLLCGSHAPLLKFVTERLVVVLVIGQLPDLRERKPANGITSANKS